MEIIKNIKIVKKIKAKMAKRKEEEQKEREKKRKQEEIELVERREIIEDQIIQLEQNENINKDPWLQDYVLELKLSLYGHDSYIQERIDKELYGTNINCNARDSIYEDNDEIL